MFREGLFVSIVRTTIHLLSYFFSSVQAVGHHVFKSEVGIYGLASER